MSLSKTILNYQKNKLLFTTPSHSQGQFVPPNALKVLGKRFYQSDYSEVEGLDNLRKPESIIKELQNKITQIYDTKASFMLTNGSTSGIITAMLATLKDNDKVLIARNCHISVYNGLILSGAEPIWFMPEYDENWDIYKGITAKQINNELLLNDKIKAIILTSPTYEGLYSEVEDIARICKEKDIILIIDEAHGSLLNFYDFNIRPSIQLGADITINSLHKTAGAPNPCALLHVGKNSKVKTEKIQSMLNTINTTSPSYPLLCAIESTVEFLASTEGKKKLLALDTNINSFIKGLNKNIEVYKNNNDPTKILLKFKNINSTLIAKLLNEKYNVEEEFTNQKALLFITGIGTTSKKIKKLQYALNLISLSNVNEAQETISHCIQTLPTLKLTPRNANKHDSYEIDKNQAINKICGDVIIEYPPGIALILPGEVFSKEIIDKINSKRVKVINTTS